MLSRVCTIALSVFVLVTLGGCGEPTHKSILEDMVEEMEDATEVLKDVKDEASAKAAAPKLKSIAAEMKKLSEQARKMKDPDKDAQKELEKEMMPKVQKAAMAYGTEAGRAEMKFFQVTEFRDAMRELRDSAQSPR